VLHAVLSPLGIAATLYFAIPYIVALVAILIAVALLLFRFPYFRKYRRKSNILIYFTVALTLVLLVYQIDFVARTAVVTYSIDTSEDRFYVGELNEISVKCSNRGDRACSFDIVVSSVNMSFSVGTSQTYFQVNSTAVKVPFTLQENGSSMNGDSKPVFFTINENVTGFSFRLLLEAHAFNSIKVYNAGYAVSCVWNATENCYELDGALGFTA
jgi:hypothetical protein